MPPKMAGTKNRIPTHRLNSAEPRSMFASSASASPTMSGNIKSS